MLFSPVGHGQARINDEHRREKGYLKPTEALEDIPLDKSNPEKFTRIRTSMEMEMKQDLVHFLKKSMDVFTWSH